MYTYPHKKGQPDTRRNVTRQRLFLHISAMIQGIDDGTLQENYLCNSTVHDERASAEQTVRPSEEAQILEKGDSKTERPSREHFVHYASSSYSWNKLLLIT